LQEVGIPGARRKVPHLHVLDHALPKDGHGKLLCEQGGIVANGERGYVVIDHAGGHHALNKIVSSERKPEHRARAAGRDEFEESRRLGTDVNAIRSAILDAFEKSDGGRAFNAATDYVTECGPAWQYGGPFNRIGALVFPIFTLPRAELTGTETWHRQGSTEAVTPRYRGELLQRRPRQDHRCRLSCQRDEAATTGVG
jgi:hypothetical protein